MKIRELLEAASAGATGSGNVATVAGGFGGKKRSEVGSLFGGTYGESSKKKQPKVIKRQQ